MTEGNCLVYNSTEFTYSYGVNLSIIILSSLSLIANVFLIITYILTLCFTKKTRSSSLDKLFLALSIVESFISLYWIVNNSYIFYNFKGIYLDEYKCTTCKRLAISGVFIYFLDWTLLSFIIFQFKYIISNPISAVFKKRNIFYSILISSVISGIAALCSQIGNVNGPMFTCFININGFKKEFIGSENQWGRIFSILSFSILGLIPSGNFLYGLYQSSIMLYNINIQNDKEAKQLFYRYIWYFMIYILSTFILFLLHISDFFIDEQKTKTSFLIFRYVTSIINCSTPLMVALFRLLQKYTILKRYCCCRRQYYTIASKTSSKAGNAKNTSSIDIDNSIIKQPTNDFEKLEEHAIKRMIRDIHVSLCYIMNKAIKRRDPQRIFSLKSEDYKETLDYQITLTKIKENKEESFLQNDPCLKEANNINIKVFEFSPKVFAHLRKIDQITEEQLIISFLPHYNEQAVEESQGKSGNLFLTTYDKQFCLKTINQEELYLIKDYFLEKMTQYLSDNQNSIISRIYGIYKIILPTGFFQQEEIILILMKNVCDIFCEQILAKFDLKGSKYDRTVTISEDSIQQKVMKDNNFEDFEKTFLLNDQNYQRFIKIVTDDGFFFCQQEVMDYSLLVVKVDINEDEMKYLFGMNHREKTEQEYIDISGLNSNMRVSTNDEIESIKKRPINEENIRFDKKSCELLRKYFFPSLHPNIMYVFSIIDFFQIYNFQKQLETQMKRIVASRNNISSAEPNDYFTRFITFIQSKGDSRNFFKEINQTNKN